MVVAGVGIEPTTRGFSKREPTERAHRINRLRANIVGATRSQHASNFNIDDEIRVLDRDPPIAAKRTTRTK